MMETRICVSCRQAHPLTMYPSGRGRFNRTTCNRCRWNDWQRQPQVRRVRNARRRQATP